MLQFSGVFRLYEVQLSQTEASVVTVRKALCESVDRGVYGMLDGATDQPVDKGLICDNEGVAPVCKMIYKSRIQVAETTNG